MDWKYVTYTNSNNVIGSLNVWEDGALIVSLKKFGKRGPSDAEHGI